MYTLRRLLILAGLAGSTVAYPDHAECRVLYKVPLGCSEAKQRILNQMAEWDKESECRGNCEKVSRRRGPPIVPVNYEGTSDECTACPCGQKCLYNIEEQTNNLIKGSHFTPVLKYEDAVSFQFTDKDDNSCEIDGFSTALLSFAYYDFGTNYCNLRNLMDGSGISVLPGFEETTNVDVCMQLDRINCAKY